VGFLRPASLFGNRSLQNVGCLWTGRLALSCARCGVCLHPSPRADSQDDNPFCSRVEQHVFMHTHPAAHQAAVSLKQTTGEGITAHEGQG
jgi:endogenous inhibitor of DNA gyrase (YacG/DUF329 family)